MSTISADVSLITKAAPAAQRLPRLVGWGLTAMAAGALWFGLFELIRLAL